MDENIINLQSPELRKINYALEMKRKHVKIRDICDELHISSKKLYKYEKLADENGIVHDLDVPGRKPTLTREETEDLYEQVCNSTSQMKAMTKLEFNQKINELVQVKKKTILLRPVSAKTCLKIQKKIGVCTHKATTKTNSRIEAYNDIRNPISYCSILNFIQQRVHPANFYSIDDVAVLFNQMGEKLQVVISKDIQKRMENQSVSIATMQPSKKQRSITFSCTISGYSDLAVTCIKFADYNFTNYTTQPKIYKLNTYLFIALYHYDMDDETVNSFIYKDIIIPTVCTKRMELINHSQTQHTDDNPYKYIAIFQDGAIGQIRAIEHTLLQYCDDNNMNIIFGKYAAGTSLTESPNDHGIMHALLHKFFKSSSDSENIEYTTFDWIQLKEDLNVLDSQSFSSVWSCLLRAPNILNRAFTRHNISKAFSEAGIISSNGQFSDRRILAHCPHWYNLNSADQNWLISKLPEFYEIFTQNGYIPEETYDNILGERSHIDTPPHRVGMLLNDMVINRQRNLIIGTNMLHVHQLKRKEIQLENSKKQKNKKCNFCSHLKPVEINWSICKFKGCTFKLCSDCSFMMSQHEVKCSHGTKKK